MTRFATDGVVVGNTTFLTHYTPDNKIGYEQIPAKIESIMPIEDQADQSCYTFRISEDRVKTLNITKSLSSLLNGVFGVNGSTSLVGTPVTLYMEKSTLMGFEKAKS